MVSGIKDIFVYLHCYGSLFYVDLRFLVKCQTSWGPLVSRSSVYSSFCQTMQMGDVGGEEASYRSTEILMWESRTEEEVFSFVYDRVHKNENRKTSKPFLTKDGGHCASRLSLPP